MAQKEKNIIRKRLVRSYVTSVISISLVLTLMGAATIFWASAGSISRYFKETFIVSLILRPNVDDSAAAKFMDELSSREYIKDAEYISKEMGAEELKTMLGGDFLDIFEVSPVPASIDLHLRGDMVSKDSLAVINAALSKDDRVAEVDYKESLVEALNANLAKITLFLSFVIILLLVISYALINNTVRLNIYTRRFTIHTMHLVGARNSFVARPFVKQALVQGAVSGLIADAIISGVILYIRGASSLLYSLFDKTIVCWCLVGIVAAGMIICASSAAFVVGRLAYSSKDDLYY